MPEQERLQKVLARAGIASRRHAEGLIVAGRVRVNGRVATELGTRVDPHHDKVEVDGRRIVLESPVYALLHKPRGVVTTMSDPEGRPTIAPLVETLAARVFPVGRLDFHTSGALLVTNDGALAQALLHPRHHVPKVYVCKVRGVPTDLQLDLWRNGVKLLPTESDPDEKPTKTLPAEVHVLRSAPPGEDSVTGAGSTWVQVTLREGRTRQIHRMAEATGLFVMRLVRVSFAGLTTEGLRPGEYRELTDKEVTALRVKYLRPLEQGAFEAPAPRDEEEPRRAPKRVTRPRREDAGGGGEARRGAEQGGVPRREGGERREGSARREGGERREGGAWRGGGERRDGVERRGAAGPRAGAGRRGEGAPGERTGGGAAGGRRRDGEARGDERRSGPSRGGGRLGVPAREGDERRAGGARGGATTRGGGRDERRERRHDAGARDGGRAGERSGTGAPGRFGDERPARARRDDRPARRDERERPTRRSEPSSGPDTGRSGRPTRTFGNERTGGPRDDRRPPMGDQPRARSERSPREGRTEGGATTGRRERREGRPAERQGERRRRS